MVGGEDDVRCAADRVVRGERLGLEDVQAGPGETAVVERPADGRLVEDTAAARVHEDRAGAHRAQERLVHEVVVGSRIRDVDAHVVRPGDEPGEIDRLHADQIGRAHV